MIMKTTLILLLSVILSAGSIYEYPQKKVTNCKYSSMEFKDTVLNNQHNTIIKGRFIENDTTFFLKEYDNENGKRYLNTIIYVEPDKNSVNYRTMEQPVFNPDTGLYELFYWRKYRQEKNLPPLTKVDLLDFPTDWLPLRSYQNHYYIVKPCNKQLCLTDSTLACFRMEFFFDALRKLQKISNSLYYIELENTDISSSSRLVQIYVHVIDDEKKVAIWEYRKKDKTYYELMIPVESAKYFDLIVRHCYLHLFINEEFFQYDAIDFTTLLKNKKL